MEIVTRYRSRPVEPTECEAMQWEWARAQLQPEPSAQEVIDWVTANGGQARYTPNRFRDPASGDMLPGIDIRTVSGWTFAAPSHFVVKRSVRFCPHDEYGEPGHNCDGCVDFYSCDPGMFRSRWEPVPDGDGEDHSGVDGAPLTEGDFR